MESKIKRAENLLLFLTVLFLPTQLGKHFWPDFAYIYSLKIDYLSPVVYFWDMLLLSLFFCWFCRRPKINSSAFTVLLFFFLSQATSLFFADNIGGGFVRLKDFLVAGSFGLYVASSNSESSRPLIGKALFFGVVYSFLIGLWQVLSGKTLGLWFLGERSFSLSTTSIATFNWYGEVFLRAYGTFPHPNVLAAFMVISHALVGILLKDKRVNLVCHLLASSTVLLTFSRSAFLVALAQNYGFFKGRIKLLGIIGLLILPVFFVRFDSAFNFDNLTWIRRFELAQISVNLFYKDPLFGVGLNNFINQVATSPLISGPNRFLQPVHNIFLLELSETGLLGFSGFLLLIFYPFLKLKKMATKNSMVLMSSFFIILFLGSFDHYFLTLAQGQRLFFLVWALSMLELKNENSSESFKTN